MAKTDLKKKYPDFNSYLPIGLGCSTCVDLSDCKGDRTQGVFGCESKCCGQPDRCTYLCRHGNLSSFISTSRAIKGLDLQTIDRFAARPFPPLPRWIPIIQNSYGRNNDLFIPAIGVRINDVLLDGERYKYRSRNELFSSLKVSGNPKLVISGIAKDPWLVKYWLLRKKYSFIEKLKALSPDLVTAPNFSTFKDAPLTDNLYSQKRIAICWEELNSAGIFTSLHLNARTEGQWDRMRTFILKRPEVTSVSVEFGTGLKSYGFATFYLENLIRLPRDVNRDLQLVIRGGKEHIPLLKESYTSVVFLDTTLFMQSFKKPQIAPRKSRDEIVNDNSSRMNRLDTYYQNVTPIREKEIMSLFK